ncbi:MAG TPA: hypothetical protein VF511_06640 [Chthoniobacterales bacterium]
MTRAAARSPSRCLVAATLLLVALSVATRSNALDLYWDVNGLAAGAGGPSPNGTWGTGTSSNFTADPDGLTLTSVPTTSSDTVHFSAGTDATGVYNVNLGASQSVAGIVFEEGETIINPTDSAQRLTISSGGIIRNDSGHVGIINVNIIGSTSLSVLGANDVWFAQVANSSAPLTMTVGVTGDGSSRIVHLGNTSGVGNDATNTNLAVVVNSGTLLLARETNDNAAPNGVTVNNSGTLLAGMGTIGATTVNANAAIGPGMNPGAVGTIASGNLTLASTSIFQVDIAQPTSFDQLVVSGSVNVTGATLSLSLLSGQSFTAGQRLTLIVNDNGDAISGTFAGLPQGGIITATGYSFTADYLGGSGNDFDLVAVPEPSTYLAGSLAVLALGVSQRRPFTRLLKRF